MSSFPSDGAIVPRAFLGRFAWLLTGLVIACGRSADPCQHSSTPPSSVGASARIQTVFLIVMENHAWSEIAGSPSAPYLTTQLLPSASYAEQYFNPPGLHPSEPNYLWLEGGTSYGIHDDGPPSANHVAARDHLANQLESAGISWTSYQEGIDGRTCPLSDQGKYTPRHNPMVFFDDVTSGEDPSSVRCISHVRPLSELGPALGAGSVSGYVLITPDLCDDMHDAAGCATSDTIRNGDAFLATLVPQILASAAFHHGALFITWDESDRGDGPIGMILLSPYAKGTGFASSTHHTHGSTLRTLQEIFGVRPFLCDAASETDLADLFVSFPEGGR
jgi:hypothetical protein